MKGNYFLFIDDNDCNNIIVYVRDENKTPMMIWNFYGKNTHAHLHILTEWEDENGNPQGTGSIIKRVNLNGDFDFETLKSNLGTNWITTSDFDILSLTDKDTEHPIQQILQEQDFYNRTNLLDTYIV